MIGNKEQDNQVFKRKIRTDHRCRTCGGLHTLQKRVNVQNREYWRCNECGSAQPE